MSKTTLAGAVALLGAPLLVLVGVAAAPTVSDDAAAQVAAFADHRSAMIAGLFLQTIALALLIGGTIWLALVLASRTPRLALAGGVLAVLGSLFPLVDNGIVATAAPLVSSLGTVQATAALEAVQRSAFVTAAGPLSLLHDLGLVLLGLAAAKAGAPRWAAIVVALGAVGESVGFPSGSRPLLLVGFALLLVGLAAVTRALVAEPRRRADGVPAVATTGTEPA